MLDKDTFSWWLAAISDVQIVLVTFRSAAGSLRRFLRIAEFQQFSPGKAND